MAGNEIDPLITLRKVNMLISEYHNDMFCELVGTLRFITALLQQFSHGLIQITYKQLLYITSKTIKYATV